MFDGNNNPELMDLVFREDHYWIYRGENPLRTRKGKPFSHINPRLMQHVITGVQLRENREEHAVIAYRLFEYRSDFLDEGLDFISEHFHDIASSDELICLKTGTRNEKGGHPSSDSIEPINYDDPLFNTLFLGFSSMITNFNAFIAENIHLVETESDEDPPFILLLRQYYQQMSPDLRSAVHLLSFLHGSGIVLPILFVLDRITASEYANGLLSMHNKGMRGQGVLSRIKDEFPYEPMDFQVMDATSVFLAFYGDAVEAGEYLQLVRATSGLQPRLPEIIARGEGNELEFKSTFRWDLKAGKTNPAVERASLKTITAFLNSAGGTLLIGVRDDGSLEGIESDRFVNDDKFLLHLWTLIRTSLGRDVSPYIQTLIEKKEEKTVCVVKCSKSPKPVFLRQPGFNEEFYIRAGPGSNALDISEALRYISENF